MRFYCSHYNPIKLPHFFARYLDKDGIPALSSLWRNVLIHWDCQDQKKLTLFLKTELLRVMTSLIQLDWKNNRDLMCSCPRVWRLSASWGPNWGHPLKPLGPSQNSIILRGLRGYPIMPRYTNLSDSEGNFLQAEIQCLWDEESMLLGWERRESRHQGVQLRAPLKPSVRLRAVMVRGVSGWLSSIGRTWLPRYASLSECCTWSVEFFQAVLQCVSIIRDTG